MLIYGLAAILCGLYATDTILVAYSYRTWSDNPHSSQLLFLSEGLKLFLATCLFLAENPAGRNGFSLLPKIHPTDKEQHAGLLPKSPLTKWEALLAKLKGVMLFAVPALCYFTTNNLSFYALRIMSAHTYTLLGDLKVITTCVLSYLVLDKHLNRQAVLSLLLLFAGICIGQYATMGGSPLPPVPAAAVTAASNASAAAVETAAVGRGITDFSGGGAGGTSLYCPQWLPGLLVMLVVSKLSAIASVWTEWTMNHSSYKHESINLQNARLYVAGTLLNGLYFLQSGGSLEGFGSNMRPVHWVIVLSCALMGHVTALLIKRYGNVIKVYASCVASLFAAGISHTLLNDPPPVLFYLGCGLAMFATIQLQAARAAMAAQDKATVVAGLQKASDAGEGSSPKSQQQQGFAKLGKAVALPAAASLAMLLIAALVSTQACAGSSSSSSSGMPGGAPQNQVVWNTTEAPMRVFAPQLPLCFPDPVEMNRMGAPVMNCALDARCNVGDPRCCAYINFEMLKFLDSFLSSKCLEGEWLVVYGTALGGVRNGTILAHTQDVDLALSPRAIQVLEQNATKEELYRAGYLFWHHARRGVWKLVPHHKHPSPQFRAVMLFNETVGQWETRTGSFVGGYVDGWVMWPVPQGTRCDRRLRGANFTAMIQDAFPWPPMPQSSACKNSSSSSSSSSSNTASAQQFCLQECHIAAQVQPGLRPLRIAGVDFPAASNLEELLVATYGKSWRHPNTKYHGHSGASPDVRKVVGALLQRLSVTAWGDTPFQQRKEQCRKLCRASHRRQCV
ncbi:hypothetical protein OEZ85_002878 [Tetradesmus obliquus]|uniref:Uncharacterized protein n=1 Tax=Tetradesmus obliquus TaxID=3088 RepID=A0ABY8TYX1_TETOB|nr:hypothetical protein OEZ85_002878 [Tetradesmus obliquus]